MKAMIDPQEAAELDQLRSDYLVTVARATKALGSGPDWAAFGEAEAEQAAIVHRMKAILGTTGQPWNA
ncbi:hypothetical protein [Phenylobacterium sp.]|uniref:hypothetical protein n=1 Tax=Phenylobacterium sp. TaxID=1871053 RepID=UPI00374DE3DE